MQRAGTAHDIRRGFALIERASTDPDSRHRANELGGPEHLGWGASEYLLATVSDQIALLVKAAAQRKARLKESEKITRPKVVRTTEYRPASVADMDWGVLFDDMSEEG